MGRADLWATTICQISTTYQTIWFVAHSALPPLPEGEYTFEQVAQAEEPSNSECDLTLTYEAGVKVDSDNPDYQYRIQIGSVRKRMDLNAYYVNCVSIEPSYQQLVRELKNAPPGASGFCKKSHGKNILCGLGGYTRGVVVAVSAQGFGGQELPSDVVDELAKMYRAQSGRLASWN